MTEKQKRFAEEYLKSGGNGRQAMIQAGYKGTDASMDASASRLLKNVKVQEYIQQLSTEVKDEAIADIQELSERLTNIVRGKTTEQVVVQEWTGKGTSTTKVIDKHPSEQTRLKAAEQLLKIQGAFSQKVKVEGEIPVVIYGSDDLED